MTQSLSRNDPQAPSSASKSLSVVIRACQARITRGESLRKYFDRQPNTETHLYLNRDTAFRGLEFALYLCSILEDLEDSVLILEDDMTFGRNVREELNGFSERNYSFIQLSVPDIESLDVHGVSVGFGFYLSMKDCLHYSGAYFFSKDFLRKVLAKLYFANNLAEFKFDTEVTRAVVDLGQRIVLKPGVFGTALDSHSTLGHTASETIDPYFDHSTAMRF